MTTEQTTTPEHPQLAALLPKLDSLEKSLLTNDPQMATYLKDIHKHLLQFEELAHLLTEEQIGIIIEAQQKKVGVMLVEETAKSKNGNNKKKDYSADAL